MKLDSTEWLDMNHLIFNIYTKEGLDDMRISTLTHLKKIVDFDAAAFSLLDGKNNKIIAPVVMSCEKEDLLRPKIPEYNKKLFFSGNGLCYRDTDIIPDVRRVRTDFYRIVFERYNWHYVLHMTLVAEHKPKALISLFRNIGKEDFDYEDIRIMELMRDHLTYRLMKEECQVIETTNKLTIEDAANCFSLTKREKMVLEELLGTQNNDEICKELHISVNTLKKHIVHIYQKFGIKNRRQLYDKVYCAN